MSQNCEKCEARLKEAEDRINDLEKGKISTDFLVTQFTKTSEELSSTMKKVEKTMVEMQNSLKDNHKDITNINCKIDKLDDWVQKESEKNTIDIRELQKEKMKDNIKKYGMGVVGVAGAYGLFELISGLIEKG
jgi:saccharopine dehydrogenase-like NADP-dependent oxidoreductase